ncbi:di-trans,poly-cis-decaprenylcistransferase [Candidatus Woesearchaeota archaeon]|nr:di-trans,poly-cis-decaprenylcistransferase [Candidatus Woesearchaeota archaeon]
MENKNPAPKHVGIILDGNRRFAKRLMAKPWMGHKWGAEKVSKLFEWCKDLDVKELTLYAFSMQNFNRPKEEFDYLMKIFVEFFEEAKNNKAIHDNKIRIKFIGRIHLFPKEVHEKMLELMEATKDHSDYQVNFAMAYGGREELVDAVKKIGRQLEAGEIKPEDIDADTINKNIYLNHEPDLIIRTGGDHRTSNFLVWQSWYSEWFFLEKTWPEFEKGDLVHCIDQYMGRERRFGK